MYSYKTNNSYTIYVNYAYINECRRASEKYRSEKVSTPKTYTAATKSQPRRVVKPLPDNTPVHHKSFGDGTIVSTEKNGYLTIQFGDVVRKFLYPQAFEMGFLTRA